MTDMLQLPAVQISSSVSVAWSRSSTPTLRRKRFKMKRWKNVQSEKEQMVNSIYCGSIAKEYLQLPSIEITPSSDEDTPWSNCSTPSASPRRKRFLLKKWLKVREKRDASETSSQQSSQQSSHDDDSSRFLTPHVREERKRLPFKTSKSDSTTDRVCTASNSARSTPACSPILRKRSRSPTPQNLEGENMVEKGSDHSSDKSPSTPEQGIQRNYSSQSGRSSKNSKSHKRLSKYDRLNLIKKSQSWYNHERQHIMRVLSPTYKQRNEDFRKLFKQLPDTERLIVDYSCALQRDILLQGRLYLSENWICFYSNIFRWETLLTVRLKDVCSMTKEKTARLIPNAVQVCTDTEKHFFTSFGARDRTYMMMFRLWQNALLEKPLCPKELWHFVHQCYGNELGLTSDDEDYVPPDDDFNTMGFCEEIPVEEVEVNDNSSKSSVEVKTDASPQMHKKSVTNSTLTSTGSNEAPASFDGITADDEVDCQLEGEIGDLQVIDRNEINLSANSPSLDFNDNEDIPTELSDSSETHDEVGLTTADFKKLKTGEVQAFYEDLNGRQYINEVFHVNVDKLYDLLFTDSQFLRDFFEQRRFTDMVSHPWKKEINGNQTRVILYTIALSNPLAPKTATVTETQTLYKASQESECYVIDAEVITHDVPYHDYFYTINRYSLTRVAKNKSRLRISTELKYRKQPWGLVKSFIEKNFWSGLDDYFRHLDIELAKIEKQYAAELHRQSPKDKNNKSSTIRRRKRPHIHVRGQHLDETASPVTTPTDEEVGQRIKHVAGSTQTKHIPEEITGGIQLYSVSKLLLIITFVLVLLVFLNMMLFYKLWMLEYTTQSLTTWHGIRLQESKLPQSQVEWAQLLESQQRYHDAELQKWRDILKSSVVLLDQMRNSLITLQKGIGLRDYSSETDKHDRFH
ncbi:protein Aster-B-like isoform X1 [Hemitrygon akajei]|uniref:protein Aster-B-like isoform X1 n=1 Tax=Hemitrygon akajei TaxID=2704970 RepID=UPI003BF9F833